MKAGLLTIAGLSAAVMAQPHARHQHHKRDLKIVTETDVVYATAPNVYVFVDAHGKPTSTSIEGQGHATSAPSADAQNKAWGGYGNGRPAKASSSATSTSAYVAPVESSGQYVNTELPSSSSEAAPVVVPSSSEAAPVVVPTFSEAAPAPVPTTSTSEYVAPTSQYVAPTSQYVAPTSQYVAPTSAYVAPTENTAASVASSSSVAAPVSSSTPPSGGSGHGIAYSPYKGAGGCKTQDEINSDLAKLSDYSVIRLYGTDCDQVAMVMKAAPNAKIFAGIYDITDISGAISILKAAASGGWDRFEAIAIGNELVNNQKSSPGEMAAKVSAAKIALSIVGYTGPVVTVDTFIAIINNKDTMCDIGDYIAANAHPFFDGNVACDGAGEWLKEQVQRLESACPGKKVVITETGWPWKGETNNKAVPGTSQQTTAISSIKSAVPSNLFLFNAFNDMWKTNSGATFGAEQYWGMYGYSASDAGSY